MSSSAITADYGSGGWKVAVVAILLIVMQLIMLAGRLVSRKLQKASLAIDDFVLGLSTLFTVALCALAVACEYNAREIWCQKKNMLNSAMQSLE